MPYSSSIAWPNCCPSRVPEGRETDSPCLRSWEMGHSEEAERLNEKCSVLNWVDEFALTFFFPLEVLLHGFENISMSKSKLYFVRGNKG